MKYRKLRIAWSVVCGICCVLPALLLVRSYSRLTTSSDMAGAEATTLLLSGE